MIRPDDISIIIPHLGNSMESRYALDQCLRSLVETVPDIAARERGIIVVTNGYDPMKQDETLKIPRDGLGDMHLIYQGQCKAVNAGVAATNTKWVMVTNDDMVYPPGWLERLVGFSRAPSSEDSMLCVSPKLVEPRAGAPTFIVEFCGGAGGDFDKQKFLDFVTEYYKGEERRYATGFNLPFLIRRDLWDLIGGYDINYDPWGSNSDSDLEYKIKLAGVQPRQIEDALVYHFSQTSGTFVPELHSYWEKNFAYFQEKWGFPRTDNGIWEASFTIPDEGRKFRPEWEGKYGNLY